jgi:hypothetical protein
MPISYQKAFYFWHRHLEGYDPARAIEKWNKGYPADMATAEEIEHFLADMTNRKEAGQKESIALYCIVTGQEVLENPAPLTIPEPPLTSKPESLRKRLAPKLKVVK